MKKQNNKIVLSVDDRSFTTWKSAMVSLSNVWKNVWDSWSVLGIGEINKEILCSLIDNAGNDNIQPRLEEYITDCLKDIYVKNGVASLLYDQLINSDRIKIDRAITAILSIKNKFNEIKGSDVGHRIQDWKVLEIKNLPIDGDKINISESFLKEVKERLFTRYLNEGTETQLYNEIGNLCKQLNKVNNLFREKTGMRDDLMDMINAPFFHNDDECFEPNKHNLEYRFSCLEKTEG